MNDAVVGRSILIVDDDPLGVGGLRDLLERAGYQSVRTAPPAEALSRVHERADLVVVDVDRSSGLSLLGSIREAIPGSTYLPILALTGDRSDAVKRQVLAAGATDFAVRPLDPTEVLVRVKNLLEARTLHLQLEAHRRELEERIRRHEESEQRRARAVEEKHGRVRAVLETRALRVVYQPIADLATGRVLGVEALARFDTVEPRSPDQWFIDAAEVGLGSDLELLALDAALDAMDLLDDEMFLALNLAPATSRDGRVRELLERHDPHRLVIELTEHARVDDYELLARALGTIRATGVRLAVDDAGAGYSSLEHILRLQPEIIKLNLALTRGIDADPVRRALAAALVSFANEIGSVIVAEGIETREELQVLRSLGVGAGQGYFLARPGPLATVGRNVEVAVTMRR